MGVFSRALFALLCVSALCVSAAMSGDAAGAASLLGDKTITASKDDRQISLEFASSKVAGYVQFGETRVELGDGALVREKGDRLFIIDKSNDLKILLKAVSDTKYLVLAKLKTDSEQQLRSRLVGESSAGGAAPVQQRDFEAEMRERQGLAEEKERTEESARESQLGEKERRLEAELKKFREQLEREQKKKAGPDGPGLTPEEIKKRFEEYKKQQKQSQGNAGRSEPAREAAPATNQTAGTDPVLSGDRGVKIFAAVPRHAEWREEFRYAVLVTDDARHKFDSTFNTFVGNRLPETTVNGTIRDPSGGILHSFGGVTDLDGTYRGSYIVPDNTPPLGEYSFVANTTKNFDDNTFAVAGTSEPFFVTAARGNSFNNPPVANAGSNFTITGNQEYTLDGSGSTDQDSMVLTYSWMQIGGTTRVTLDSPNDPKPSFVLAMTAPATQFDMTDFTVITPDSTYGFQNSMLAFTNVVVYKGSTILSSAPVLDFPENIGTIASNSTIPVTRQNIAISTAPGMPSVTITNSTLNISDSVLGIKNEELRFLLTVSDGEKSSNATVTATVNMMPPS